MQPLHVLYSYAGLDYDDSAHYIHHLMTAMQAEGHRVEALCPPESLLGTSLEREGFKVHNVLFDTGVKRLVSLFRLRRWLKSQHYDVINTNGHADTLQIGTAARLLRSPLVVRSYHQAKGSESALANTYIPHRVIGTSQFMRKRLLQRGMKSGQIEVVHDAVPLSESVTSIDLAKELGLTPQDFVVGSVATLNKGAGAQELIQAMAPLLREQVHLQVVIMSSKELQAQLMGFATQLDVKDQVHFIDLIPETASLMGGLDLFVFVPYEADSAMSVVQAAAAKLPVIGTQVGAIPEMMDQGKSGMLVPLHDVVALRKALTRLIEAPQLAQQMGQAGYDYTVTTGRFLLTTMQQRTEQAYRRWLEQLL